MFEVTLFSALIYTLSFSFLYYLGLCLYKRKVITLRLSELILYVTVFCIFGVAGEVLVNNIWELIFKSPLWEYRLYPAHDGDISYFFVFIWGGLGYYRYLNDKVIHGLQTKKYFKSGVIMGAEAVVLELAYNGFFLLLFGSYIFYYLPSNLGPFSHLSCLEVIPFYFAVGLLTSVLISCHKKIVSSLHLGVLLTFYWGVTASIVLF